MPKRTRHVLASVDALLPKVSEGTTKPTGKKRGRTPGYTPHPNQLRALRQHTVPEGAVLNPYGYYGRSFRSIYRLGYRKAYREESVQKKRKRLELKEKKKVALEAHELMQLARQNATNAMKSLIDIVDDSRSPEAARIAAAQVIFDRGYGKASQTSFTANLTNGKTNEIDSNELESRITKALKRVEDITGGAPKAAKGKKGPADLRKLN